LYTEPIWTCQCTGATKLTHREALESERKALKQLALSFPVVFEKPILELVHLSEYFGCHVHVTIPDYCY